LQSANRWYARTVSQPAGQQLEADKVTERGQRQCCSSHAGEACTS